jgi:dTMP kinase
LLVAVEGIDGAGKHTFSERLRSRCEEAGLAVAMFSYPRYRVAPFGPVISSFLADGGEADGVASSVGASALLFALDRAHSLPVLRAALDANDLVIVDRYIASNAAYGGARLPPADRAGFIERVADIETVFLGLPAPDAQVLVGTEPEVAWHRTRSRSFADPSRPVDSFEDDKDLQTRCAELYEELARREWLSRWWVLRGQDPESEQVVTELLRALPVPRR